MCACFATCYLAQNRAETFLDFSPAPTPFPEVPYKSSIRGREQRYLRPRVALPAAASSTNSGREQHERRPRVDNFSLPHEGHRPSGGRNLLKTQRLPAADARREGRPGCLIPPVAKRCYPRSFPLLHHAPSALLFLLFIIYNQRKEK